jgi:hypothetical protein
LQRGGQAGKAAPDDGDIQRHCDRAPVSWPML